MARIDFKGRQLVWNHHLAVPYHELIPRKDKSLTDKVSLHDNLIIKGDNLLALKALLPTYAGKVKCIYIDPPYNTGNEGWAYNDNVNSPMIKEWLGKTVDRDDLTRHDKWLCMMTPRLKLLRDLLRDDGAIFISIDDNEVHRLKLLMDEIFGEENFRSCISRATGTPTGGGSEAIVNEIDYVLVYSRTSDSGSIAGLSLTESEASIYDKEDETGKYLIRPLRRTGGEDRREDRPSMFYGIESPDGTEVFPVAPAGYESRWICGKAKYLQLEQQGLIEWRKTKRGNDEQWQPYQRFYLEGRLKQPSNLWKEVEGNKKATRDLKEIFGGEKQFDFPKPVDLVRQLINLVVGKDEIVLDSFAGSGTTAHAVLAQNAEDGGNRKFILVELEDDVADTITAERVRRVIQGVPTAKDEKLRQGLGGSFSYFELGKPIEMQSILSGERLPSYVDLARYVFYTATGEEFDESNIDESRHFIGESKEYEVYLLYEPNVERLKNLALTLNHAEAWGKPAAGAKPRLVFAPTKYLDQQLLDDYRISFAQLPFEIYELAR